MRVLSWNLFHGRDFPPEQSLLTCRSRLLRTPERGERYIQVNRSLREVFERVLGQATWDIALLQEAPPRWRQSVGHRTRSSVALALTSRNSFQPLRALLAEWNPDLLASNEGGSNQTLVRAPARIANVRRVTLATRPERRRMLLTRLEEPGGRSLAVANMHLSAWRSEKAASELREAAERAVEWAGAEPLIFGGDLNLRARTHLESFEELRERYGLERPTAPDAIDHILARGLFVVEQPAALPPEWREVDGSDGLKIRLSDHDAVTASFGMK